MSARKLKPVDSKQATISHIFSLKKCTAAALEVPVDIKTTPKAENRLSSENPRVQAFYDSLSPNEVIAHSIAVEKLGTSYDVTRTHGFLKWCKANPI
jgi:hypothetical protein